MQRWFHILGSKNRKKTYFFILLDANNQKHMFSTDDYILSKLKQGDEKALKEVVDKYYNQLFVQDFIIRLWEQKLHLTINNNLKSFLFNSVRNASVDYLRKHQPYRFVEIEEDAYITDFEPNETEIEEQVRRLKQYLKELTPKEYKVLIEIVVHNKKYKEVAEELGLSVNTIKTHLSRALKFLRSKPFISLYSLFYL